jgi:hypothetical protein
MPVKHLRQVPSLLLVHTQDRYEVARLGNAQGQISLGIVLAQRHYHLGEALLKVKACLRRGGLVRHALDLAIEVPKWSRRTPRLRELAKLNSPAGSPLK